MIIMIIVINSINIALLLDKLVRKSAINAVSRCPTGL